MHFRTVSRAAALLLALSAAPNFLSAQISAMKEPGPTDAARVTYHTTQVDGLRIFYREAGPKNAPTLVLLHGYPSSSHMFRNLIPALSDKYHVIAPDYPGFGYSDSPSPEQYAYTFDHLADTVDHFLDQQGVTKYSIYIQDYGAPVGFRLATRHPDRVQAIISQNGNAYDEGLAPFWAEFLYPYWKDPNPTAEAKVRQILTPDLTKFQYTQGFRNPENVSPDSYTFDQMTLDRTGNDKIQLALFTTIAKIHRSTPRGTNTCASIIRQFLPSGARTIRSSCQWAQRPLPRMIRARSCTCSTPDTLLWKRTEPSSRNTFASS